MRTLLGGRLFFRRQLPMDPIQPNQNTERPVERQDKSPGPPLRRPWGRWDRLARSDNASSILTAVAIAFSALPLFWQPGRHPGQPNGVALVAPLVGAAFFIALIGMFNERERRGFARILLAVGAVVLAAAGVAFAGNTY